MAITNSSLPTDRKEILLKAAYDILKKCDNWPYVLNALEQTAVWDDADCDGYCLMQEIADELDLDNLSHEDERTDTDRLIWIAENSAAIRNGGENSPDPYYFVIYRDGTSSGADNDFRVAIDHAIYELGRMSKTL